MSRHYATSGSPYEASIGFSRAVRSGDWISVSGTAPIAPDGTTSCPGDLYGQTLRCLEIIESALHSLGGDLRHIIRTRVFLTNLELWEAAAKAHGEVFGSIRPASTFVEISRLIKNDWLVEIEADAKID